MDGETFLTRALWVSLEIGLFPQDNMWSRAQKLQAATLFTELWGQAGGTLDWLPATGILGEPCNWSSILLPLTPASADATIH